MSTSHTPSEVSDTPSKVPYTPSKVPVLDPDAIEIRLIPSSLLDRADYFILSVPSYTGTFDIYGIKEPNGPPRFGILTAANDNISMEMDFLCRLRFRKAVGWRIGMMRMVSSRYRQLWVGKIPEGVTGKMFA